MKTAGEALRDAPNRAMFAAMVRVEVKDIGRRQCKFRDGEDAYDGRFSKFAGLRHPGDSISVPHTIAG